VLCVRIKYPKSGSRSCQTHTTKTRNPDFEFLFPRNALRQDVRRKPIRENRILYCPFPPTSLNNSVRETKKMKQNVGLPVKVQPSDFHRCAPEVLAIV